jgi:hypothetical protein
LNDFFSQAAFGASGAGPEILFYTGFEIKL